MVAPQPNITYPRRVVARSMLRLAGRGFLPLLSRSTIDGRENVPRAGPLIVVGNHVAAMEVVLMVAAIDRQVEFLGTADIPPPPLMDAITRLYGFIPVFRGRLEREAMAQALDVLRQGGVLGLFPEGGIWRTGRKRARKGVAWLSHRSGAPIIPMGFGGMEGALSRMVRLRRPRFTVRIGRPMAPVELTPGRPRSEALDEAAQRVLTEVIALLPPEDRPQVSDVAEETFSLAVTIVDPSGSEIEIPAEMGLEHGGAVSRMIFHPAITDVYSDRLHLPVDPFRRLEAEHEPARIARASQAVLDYLDEDNPYFLTYRFGIREGGAMHEGLQEVLAVARWAERGGFSLRIEPVRRYRLAEHEDWAEQRSVSEAHAW